MEQFLDSYGGTVELNDSILMDTSDLEMCFVQYLPVRIPMQKSSIAIPRNLEAYTGIVQSALMRETLRGNRWSYVYLTVKRMYGVCNREGWHCDGFGTDDVNYIWFDSHPTEFYTGPKITLPHSHRNSMLKMSELLYGTNKIDTMPVNCLIRLDQSVIHRVNSSPFSGLRTFVKVSLSDSKYNLKGNAHNHLLDYDWDMVDREVSRNHPIGGS